MTAAPTIEYGQRAGANPEPARWAHDFATAHADLEAALAATATTGWAFWADIAEFQRVVDGTYPYGQLAIRLDTGWRLDNHAKANHAAVQKIAHIEALIGYVVFVPGQSKAILSRIKNAFGAHLEGIAPMTDMESGSGFAGPGNHSSEANDFVNELAAATSDRKREVGYANGGDWANNWPTRPPWLKRITANYGTQAPSTWGWQYYGGLSYPTPTGFPRACKPFGSWVDMNARKTTHNALLDELGLDWLSMATEAQLDAKIAAAVKASETRQQKWTISTIINAMRALVRGDKHGPFGPDNTMWVDDAGGGVYGRFEKLGQTGLPGKPGS